MKKSLTLVLMATLLMTGCSGKAAADAATARSASPVATTATATATTAGLAVPNEVGKTLDVAQKDLEGLGFKVSANDAVEGKSILVRSNWEVISQNPAANSSAPRASVIYLGVKHLVASPTPKPTTAPTAQTGAGAGGGGADVYANPNVPNVQNVPDEPVVPKGGVIVCKDGYVWPGTTRQGACHGHNGIAN